MEPRVIDVLEVRHDTATCEHSAHGTVSRYGFTLQWEAHRGAGDWTCNVWFPRQAVGDEGDDAIVLVYEGDPCAGDDIRTELNVGCPRADLPPGRRRPARERAPVTPRNRRRTARTLPQPPLMPTRCTTTAATTSTSPTPPGRS